MADQFKPTVPPADRDAMATSAGRARARTRDKRHPVLRWLHGPGDDVGWTRSLDIGTLQVGRGVDRSRGIHVDDVMASRLHATLEVLPPSRRVRLVDAASSHGSWVNGARVSDCFLDDGDVVRIGDTHLMLRLVPEHPRDAEVPALLGSAPSVAAMRHDIAQVARHDVSVLILGESGSGKEVVARAIHEASGRSGGFLALNCAAIPAQLAESQLFGHTAGAFTGAKESVPGFFRAAGQGTVFLDEIGDMPLELQPKLLRALEQREVTPLGASQPVPFEARVLAATHRDLERAVIAGSFRGDLYARLAQFQLPVPPLRQRREDVLPLLAHAMGGDMPPLEPDLVDALLTHEWRFNVRELIAIAGELEVRGRGLPALGLDLVAHRFRKPSRPPRHDSGSYDVAIGVKSLDPPRRPAGEPKSPVPTREQLEALVAEHRGNVRAISRITGRSRAQVYRWLRQYGLDLSSHRED